MKRKIIFESILSVFILLLLPSVPAVEYNVAVETNQSNIINKIKCLKIDIKDIKEELKNINIEELKEKIQNIDWRELKDKIKDIEIQKIFNNIKAKITDQKEEPKFIITLSIIKILFIIIYFIITFGTYILYIIINTLFLIVVVIWILINLLIFLISNIIRYALATIIGIIDIIIDQIKEIFTFDSDTIES